MIKRFTILIFMAVFLFSSFATGVSASTVSEKIDADSEYYNSDGDCSTTGSNSSGTSPSGTGGSVYILGDSITVRSATEYTSALTAAGYTATIDGSSSRSLNGAGIDGNMLSGMAAIAQDAPVIKQASQIVIALGTNGGDTDQSIDQAIAAIKADNSKAPIYWVDTISIDRTDGYNASVIGPANQAIYSQAQSQGYSVISWFKTVDPTGNPEQPTASERDPNNYIDNSDGLGVHPDPAGSAALANLVKNAIAGGGTTEPGGSTGTSTGGTSITMQKVDLSAFHPDPAAVSFFNSTILPKVKANIPMYVQAAEAEGVPQNWEILAALQAPESAMSNTLLPSSDGKGAGPWQESYGELTPYLSDPTYGPVLSQLITPGGGPVASEVNQELTPPQFVDLARLVFKQWISTAPGVNYPALKNGPIAFDPSIDSSNTWYNIMVRWNGIDAIPEGFPGYDAANPANGYDGSATWYYLLKQWEANGGMSTVSIGSSSSTGCSSGTTSSSGSVNCTSAVGSAKILCAAQIYAGIYYNYGGGHETPAPSAYNAACPDPSKPPDNQATGSSGSDENPSPCAVDCSSLVSLAVDDAFNQHFMWTVNGGALGNGSPDTTDWTQLSSVSQVQPGDIATASEHVEIVVSYDSQTNILTTYGAHHGGTTVGQVTTSPGSTFTEYYSYKGPQS